jgi:hypothetical protein
MKRCRRTSFSPGPRFRCAGTRSKYWSLERRRRSVPPFGRHTSCCPFCTVSFRLPVFGAMSKTAGCSSVTESAVSLGLLVVCARTGAATQVESPMSAARRVTLIVIPVAPERLTRCRSTHAPKTLLEKLNCTLPSLPARGQRCSQAARAIDAFGDGMSAPGSRCAVPISPRTSAIRQDSARAMRATIIGVGWRRERTPSRAQARLSDRACLQVESSQIPARFTPRLSVAYFAAIAVPKEEPPTT